MKQLLAFVLLSCCLSGLLLWSQTTAELVNSPQTADTLDLARLVLDSLDTGEARLDSLFYSADSIYFDNALERLYLFGSTNVRYLSSNISSDSLFLDINAERAYSFGPTVMQDLDQVLLGRNVRFDIESQEGILEDGSSQIEKAFYTGQEIRKVGDDIYDVDQGSFTTCDDIDPCFHFSAAQLRIYRGDKIVGKPVIAWVNDFPVFYFPFFTIPIRRGRHPGFLIPEPGYNSFDGKYIKDIAWYYPYKDYADLTLSLDLKEKTGWKLSLDSDYILRYKFNGNFKASYNRSIIDEVVNNDWAIRANHHHELGEKSTLDANIDFITNKRIWESSSDINESLVQRLSSSLSYRKPLLSSYLNVGATYTQDLINDNVYLSLPSASFSMPSRPVYELFYKPERAVDAWWSNFSWNYAVRLDHTGYVNDPSPGFEDLLWSNRLDPNDSTRVITEHHAGINHRLGLSYNWKLRGWLNFRQGIDYNESWYDRDKNGEKWVRGANYNTYFNTSFNLYGTRNYAESYIRSIRHIVTPTLGINYTPDFTDNSRFYSFGGISNSSGVEAANLSLGIDQKWQVKYGRGDNANLKKLNDILSLSSRISANLLKEDKPLGTISHSLALRPGSFDLGNLKLSPDFSFQGLKLAYSASYSLAQDPYKVSWGDAAFRGHYFSQSISLGASAPYIDYFPHTKNNLFDAYLVQDTTLVEPETTTKEGSDNWNISLAHDLYAAKLPWHPDSHNLRMNTTFKFSDNWALTYNNYINLKEGDLISQSFGLMRNLHCWKLEITYTRRNDYWEYKVALFNSVLPDALRFQNRDSGRN